MLRDGETQVLAGLINDEERATLTKVPGLGDLPWIGKLFTSQNLTHNKTEIALLITPRIVRNISRPAKTDSEFHYGTENAAGMLPVTIGKVAARSLAMSSSSATGARTPRSDIQRFPLLDESRAATAQIVSPAVSLIVPEQVSPGKDFAVGVSLAGAENLSAAELELNYDPSQVEALDEGEKSGTRLLKVGKGGGTVDLRFRVIAQKPGTTQIGIKGATLQGEGENSGAQVMLPPAANIDIR
jgi:general secretion pathway protein D